MGAPSDRALLIGFLQVIIGASQMQAQENMGEFGVKFRKKLQVSWVMQQRRTKWGVSSEAGDRAC